MTSAYDVAYEGTPTWDIGRPQGAVLRLAASGALAGSLLDVGCGTGEHALLLAERGHRVTGLDLAPRAIAKARAKAEARGLAPVLVVGDALALGDPASAPVAGPFDAALDVGLFHVLQHEDRRRYASSLAAVVRRGGRAFVLCWSDRNPFGYGPERIGRSMLRHTFVAATGWRIDAIEPEVLETRLTPGLVHAWLARLSRR